MKNNAVGLRQGSIRWGRAYFYVVVRQRNFCDGVRTFQYDIKFSGIETTFISWAVKLSNA